MTRRFPKETEWTNILLAAHRLGLSVGSAMKVIGKHLYIQTKELDRLIKEHDEGRLKALEDYFQEQRMADDLGFLDEID